MSTREKFEVAFKSDSHGFSLVKDENGEFINIETFMAEYGFNLGYESRDKEIERFIDFVDGIQGRDLGGADILSWRDISSAEDLRGFLQGYRALQSKGGSDE